MTTNYQPFNAGIEIDLIYCSQCGCAVYADEARELSGRCMMCSFYDCPVCHKKCTDKLDTSYREFYEMCYDCYWRKIKMDEYLASFGRGVSHDDSFIL